MSPAVAPLTPWPAIGDVVAVGSSRYSITSSSLEDVRLEAIASRMGPRHERGAILHLAPASLVFDRIRGEWRQEPEE